MDIVFAADRLYFRFLAVAMESLYQSARDPAGITVHLVSPDLSQRAAAILDALAARHGGSFCGHTLRRLPLECEVGLSPHFYRLFAPQLLPADVCRFLYLDSDLLVLDDLTELFQLDMSGAVIAAAIDYLPTISVGISNYASLGLPGDDPYFNSGVIMVDRNAWSAAEIACRVLETTRQNASHLDALGRFHQYDQYALNVVLHGRWTVLDRRWNYGSELPYDSNAAIVHFNGHGKPWSPTCTREFRQQFARLELELERMAAIGRVSDDWTS